MIEGMKIINLFSIHPQFRVQISFNSSPSPFHPNERNKAPIKVNTWTQFILHQLNDILFQVIESLSCQPHVSHWPRIAHIICKAVVSILYTLQLSVTIQSQGWSHSRPRVCHRLPSTLHDQVFFSNANCQEVVSWP